MSARTGAVASWLASPPPPVAVEITSARVTAVALADSKGDAAISAHATQPLESGVVTPALNAPNIHDLQALAAAIRSVLDSVAARTKGVALVLPDAVAKVSLLRFEKVPAKAQDLEQLIRWQVRKAAPFRIEDAQVAWQAGAPLPGGGREYLVSVARRDLVRGFERACEAAGFHAGIVDIATFNQINAVAAGSAVAGDWMLVNVAPDYATVAIVRDEAVISFRNRGAAAVDELADLVHQTAMYHEDRLGGGGFSRVVLAGTAVLGAAEGDRFRRLLGERLGMAVDAIDFRPGAEMRDRVTPSPELLDILAAPVGVLLRERAPVRPVRTAPGQVA